MRVGCLVCAGKGLRVGGGLQVGVPGLLRERPGAGRSEMETSKVLVEKAGLQGRSVSGSSWTGLEEGLRGTSRPSPL